MSAYVPRNILTGVVIILVGVALFGLASGFHSAVGRKGGFDDTQMASTAAGNVPVRDVVPLDQSALVPAGPTDEEIAAEKKAAEEKKLAEEKKKLEADKAAAAEKPDVAPPPPVVEPPPPVYAPPPPPAPAPEQPALY